MGESMELHPLAAIFGVMAGGEVAGILGIYFSIPVMASLRIVFRRWRLYTPRRKSSARLPRFPFAPRKRSQNVAGSWPGTLLALW